MDINLLPDEEGEPVLHLRATTHSDDRELNGLRPKLEKSGLPFDVEEKGLLVISIPLKSDD